MLALSIMWFTPPRWFAASVEPRRNAHRFTHGSAPATHEWAITAQEHPLTTTATPPLPHRRLTHKSKGKGLRKPGGRFTSYPGRIHTDYHMAKNVSPRRRPKQTEGTPLCPSTPPFLLIVQSVKAQRPTHLDAQALSATCS